MQNGGRTCLLAAGSGDIDVKEADRVAFEARLHRLGVSLLAGRATHDISSQIAQIQASTGSAVNVIGGIIEEMSARTACVAAAVEEQGAATSEIARNVRQTAHATHGVTMNITGVSRGSRKTGVAASQVLEAAADLARRALLLSSEVGGFIVGIQAA